MEYSEETKFIAFVEKQIRRIEESKQETEALKCAGDRCIAFYNGYDEGLERMLKTVCDHFGLSFEGIKEDMEKEASE